VLLGPRGRGPGPWTWPDRRMEKCSPSRSSSKEACTGVRTSLILAPRKQAAPLRYFVHHSRVAAVARALNRDCTLSMRLSSAGAEGSRMFIDRSLQPGRYRAHKAFSQFSIPYSIAHKQTQTCLAIALRNLEIKGHRKGTGSFRGSGFCTWVGEACSAHLSAQLSISNGLPGPDRVCGNGEGLRKVRCCNHAATGAGRIRTEQENDGARNGKTACICDFFRQGRTHPESFDLTYKEGGAGSNPASLTMKKR
jgi:hypothetical protein